MAPISAHGRFPFMFFFFFPLATASFALVRCSLRRWGVFLRRGWGFALFCVASSYLLAVACAHTDTVTETQGFQLVRVSLRVVPVKRALFYIFFIFKCIRFLSLMLGDGRRGAAYALHKICNDAFLASS